MPKFAFLLIVAVAAANSLPTQQSNFGSAVESASAPRSFEEFDRLYKSINFKPISLGDIRSLKPEPGGHVYGESEYTFHKSSNINGRKNEQSGGHKVINDDGKVTEYDFKP